MNIFRAIAAVIVGYIVIAAVIMASFTVAFLYVLGVEGSYKPGTWDVSTTWVIMSLVVGLIAAVLGGVVCTRIAVRRSPAPMVLAGLVVVLGIATAALRMNWQPPDDRPEVPPADLANLDAPRFSNPSPLVDWANPFVGCIGVLIGTRLARKK